MSKKPVKTFRPHSSVVLAMIAATLLFMMRAIGAGVGDEGERASEYSGRVVAMVLLPYMFGTFAFLIARRSNFVGNVVLGLMAMLSFGGGFASMGRAQASSQVQAFAASAEETRLEMNRAVDAYDSVGVAKAADKAVGSLESAAQQTDGDERVGLEAMAAYAKQSAELLAAVYKAGDAFFAAGGLDVHGVKTAAELDRRLELLAEMQSVCDAYTDWSRTSKDAMLADIRARYKSKSFLASTEKMFDQRFGPLFQVSLELRECESSMVREQTAMLTVLRDHFGSWMADEQGVIFSDWAHAEMEQYNTHARAFDELARREADLTARGRRFQEQLKPR